MASARVRGHTLSLVSADGDDGPCYELRHDDVVFRSSLDDGASEALIEALMVSVSSARHLDILIGGLGFGAALRAALKYPGVRKVTVVELDNRVLNWGRAHFHLDDLLDDPRTEIIVGGLGEYLQGTSQSYHGIALDLDFTPERVIRPENRRCYSLTTLKVMGTRLRSGGRLAIRGAALDRAYTRALDEAFSVVEIQELANPTPGGGVIYLAGD